MFELDHFDVKIHLISTVLLQHFLSYQILSVLLRAKSFHFQTGGMMKYSRQWCPSVHAVQNDVTLCFPSPLQMQCSTVDESKKPHPNLIAIQHCEKYWTKCIWEPNFSVRCTNYLNAMSDILSSCLFWTNLLSILSIALNFRMIIMSFHLLSKYLFLMHYILVMSNQMISSTLILWDII